MDESQKIKNQDFCRIIKKMFLVLQNPNITKQNVIYTISYNLKYGVSQIRIYNLFRIYIGILLASNAPFYLTTIGYLIKTLEYINNIRNQLFCLNKKHLIFNDGRRPYRIFYHLFIHHNMMVSYFRFYIYFEDYLIFAI